jgi:cardiolipin synthase
MDILDDGWFAALSLLVVLAIQLVLAVTVLLRPQARQSSSLAWILVILLIPGLGIVCWLIFGEVRIGKGRIRRYADIQDEIHGHLANMWAKRHEHLELTEVDRSVARIGQAVCDTDPRGGNAVELLADTDEVVRRMAADVDAAQHSVHILVYIWLPDDNGTRLAQAVERAARRGVACRVLVDHLGSRSLLNSELRQFMMDAGARVVPALEPPFPPFFTQRLDVRNHRKLMVIDEELAWTGSQNIADASFAPKAAFAPWVDCMLRIEGPVVADLAELFIEDWALDTGESLVDMLRLPEAKPGGVPVQILGTGPNSQSEAHAQMLQAAIHLAREEVILTTPYFVPDEGTVSALATAARRGVEVILVVPQRNDSKLVAAASRSFYSRLLSAGVHIHEYTAGLLHAKTFTLDRSMAYMGSANIDRRSFEINFEVSALILDTDFASHLRLLQRTYMESTVEVDPHRWEERALWRRAVQNAAGLLGPLL